MMERRKGFPRGVRDMVLFAKARGDSEANTTWMGKEDVVKGKVAVLFHGTRNRRVLKRIDCARGPGGAWAGGRPGTPAVPTPSITGKLSSGFPRIEIMGWAVAEGLTSGRSGQPSTYGASGGLPFGGTARSHADPDNPAPVTALVAVVRAPRTLFDMLRFTTGPST